MKTCTKCKFPKDEAEFGKQTKAKDGLRSWCKTCQRVNNQQREPRYNALRKKYREEHKAEVKARNRQEYLQNKEEILRGNAAWRQTPNGRLLSYKRSAKARGIEWLLSREEFEDLWNKPCYYCGEGIKGIGIDRIDSALSYTKANIVPCCSQCNTMKLDYTQTEFFNKIQKLWEHIQKLKET